MTEFIFAPAKQPAVAIHQSHAQFPVRRIFCVGKNYADHVREMGGDPKSDPPFFFTKPADALVADGTTIPYPQMTDNLHHEAELVVAIGKKGAEISETDALDHVWGYGAGNDLTRRDLQHDAKGAGRPWDMSKGFDNAAVCGALVPADQCKNVDASMIRALVNQDVKQNSTTAEMIWSVPAVIAYLSRFVELQPGDLIFTGTPDGVGPLNKGDSCTVEIAGLPSVTVSIA